MQVQRVHCFAKHPGNERPPVLKVTFMTEAAQNDALSEKSCLREETDLANVYTRPSHPKCTRDHRNVLFYAASQETFDSDNIVKAFTAHTTKRSNCATSSTAAWIGIPPSSSAMPPTPDGRLTSPVDDDRRVSLNQVTQSPYLLFLDSIPFRYRIPGVYPS